MADQAKVDPRDILKSGPKYKARTNVSFGVAGHVHAGQIFQLDDPILAKKLLADGTITENVKLSPTEKSKADQDEEKRLEEEKRLKKINDGHDPATTAAAAGPSGSGQAPNPAPGKPAPGTIPNN